MNIPILLYSLIRLSIHWWKNKKINCLFRLLHAINLSCTLFVIFLIRCPILFFSSNHLNFCLIIVYYLVVHGCNQVEECKGKQEDRKISIRIHSRLLIIPLIMSLHRINQEHNINCNHKCCRMTQKIIKKVHALMRRIGVNNNDRLKTQRMIKIMEGKNKECRRFVKKILRSGREVLQISKRRTHLL